MKKALKKLLIVSGSFALLFSFMFVVTAVSGHSNNNTQTTNNQIFNYTQPVDSGNYNTQPTISYSTQNTLPQVETTEEETEVFSSSKATQTVKVERVIDGDTFTYTDENGVEQKLRLIGVDTPESVNFNESKNCKYGKVASDYTKKMLTDKTVKLEFDESMRDDFQRMLAYVYIDDVMFNYDLVAKGYAVAKEFPPNTKYAEHFKNAQIEAEKNKSGMWSSKVSNTDCNLKEEYYIEY